MSFLIDKVWYGSHPIRWLLVPCAWVYKGITLLRRWYLQHFCQYTSPVPIIVVGNLTVGGVGKTPLVIALAKRIEQKGLKVGIVSRGYGARVKKFPYQVQLSDLADKAGDEPLLIAQNTLCPVVIAPRRTDAIKYLLKHHQVDLIISDDGLQHYRMGRHVELAVIDGVRGLGNGFTLPAGPLRESESRLKEVDFIIVNEGSWSNAYPMRLLPGKITNLATRDVITPDAVQEKCAAVAGIGNPQRFYSTLEQLGVEFTKYSYPDHYQFKVQDLNYPESMVVMTEKDAVKCSSFISDKLYYLPVEAQLNDAFWDAFWSHKQLQEYC